MKCSLFFTLARSYFFIVKKHFSSFKAEAVIEPRELKLYSWVQAYR